VSKDGYLVHITLLVKVMPLVGEKIVFIGFIQTSTKYEEIEPPSKEGLEKRDQLYFVTESNGNIINVSEGIYTELGLNSKFFSSSNSFLYNIGIKMLCPELNESEVMEALELGGQTVHINSSDILEFVELEALTAEEILQVKSQLGQYECYMQKKSLRYGGGISSYDVYRVIVLEQVHPDISPGAPFYQSSFTDVLFGKVSSLSNIPGENNSKESPLSQREREEKEK
jgi:hypothetical protein